MHSSVLLLPQPMIVSQSVKMSRKSVQFFKSPDFARVECVKKTAKWKNFLTLA